MMRRFLSLALVLALCLSLAASCLAEAAPAAESLIPELHVKQQEIPDNEAMAFLRRMGVGWNLGNTFDAYSGESLRPVKSDHMTTEKSWTGSYTKREVIQAVADAGFGFIRIPVSWHNHVDADFTINGDWLNRVQEVVDWALDAGLMVIVNIHHDNYPDFFYPDRAHLENSVRYVSRIWEQVAARFADYDDRLIFESLNEPRLVGTAYEWSFQSGNPVCLEAAECLNILNQTFVDTVRAAGGRNADRYLLVPGYAAAPANTNPKYFTLPTDTADNRIMVEAHGYVPYSFALEANGTPQFNHNIIMDAGSISGAFRGLYDNYISKGIPVVMDEFGSMNRNENVAARVDHAATYVAYGASYNIPVCWWDNGNFKGNGERFGIIRRSSGEWVYPEIVEAMITYRMK